MTDRIISIYGALEDVPPDFTGIAKVENANYDILIRAKNINGVISRTSNGSSDDIAYRPSAAALGKGSWQVGNVTYESNGYDYSNIPFSNAKKVDIEAYIKSAFENKVAGAWYDASDYSTLFQDLASTIPVTSVGQPVLSMHDKSGFGNTVTFSGTNPPLTAVDSDGVRILSPVDATSRGVCASLVQNRPLTTISIQSLSRSGIDVFYDSYVNNGSCFLEQASGSQSILAGGQAISISKLSNDGKSSYIVNHDATTSIYSDGFLLGSGVTSGDGFNGLSLFNLTGSPTPITTGYDSMRPFYGLIVLPGITETTIYSNIEKYLSNLKEVSLLRGKSIIAIGDSTIAPYLGYNSVISYVATVFRKQSIAIPGQTIALQTTEWKYAKLKRAAKAVIIEVGLNDLDPAVATSTTIAALQSLVTLVRANIDANAKILISQLTPCRARLISLYGGTNGPIAYQKWLDINEAIAGNGATPVNGIDARVTSHVALLNDGAGNLAAAYDHGDGIHENNAGRQIVAEAWQSALRALNIL